MFLVFVVVVVVVVCVCVCDKEKTLLRPGTHRNDRDSLPLTHVLSHVCVLQLYFVCLCPWKRFGTRKVHKRVGNCC